MILSALATHLYTEYWGQVYAADGLPSLNVLSDGRGKILYATFRELRGKGKALINDLRSSAAREWCREDMVRTCTFTYGGCEPEPAQDGLAMSVF